MLRQRRDKSLSPHFNPQSTVSYAIKVTLGGPRGYRKYMEIPNGCALSRQRSVRSNFGLLSVSRESPTHYVTNTRLCLLCADFPTPNNYPSF